MREIHLWVLPNNGFETFPTLSRHLSGFHRRHPDTRVSVSVGTAPALWRNLFRLLKDSAAKPRPDILQIPAQWASSLGHLGLLQDLRDLDPGLETGRWHPSVRDYCRLIDTNQIVALPWWMELRVLYYRRDILKKAGIDPSRHLESWDGLRDACAALGRKWASAAAHRYPMGNQNPRRSVSMIDVAPCLWSRGADFFTKDGTRVLFQRAQACRGIDDYFGLISLAAMPLSGPAGLAPKTLFDGFCAMQFFGRLPRRMNGASKRRPKIDEGQLGAVPLPRSGGKPSSILTAQSLAIPRAADSPKEAYALMRFLCDGPAAEEYPESIGAFPAVEEGFAKSVKTAPAFAETFERSMASARVMPNLRVLGTLERVFDRCMESLVEEVVEGRYEPKRLHTEVIRAAAEMDYILGLYA